MIASAVTVAVRERLAKTILLIYPRAFGQQDVDYLSISICCCVDQSFSASEVLPTWRPI